MKSSLIDNVLKMCPDTKLASRIVSGIRIRRIMSYFIPDKDVRLGESSSEEKKKIVDKYLSKEWIGIKKTADLADRILSEASQYKDREDKSDVKTDMLFKRLAYGFQPDEYLCYGLEGMEPEEMRKWISDLDRYIYIFSMNDLKTCQIFNNKARTYEAFKEYYRRDAISIKNDSDYSKFENFVSSHTEFVKKQAFQGMGRSIELVKSDAIIPAEYFKQLIAEGEHIIEGRIQQSSVMSQLNASSVNTVRCITMNTKSGIKILYTFLKVGRNGSFVDNGGAGGILAGIDENTGVINTHGYDEFITEYICHPDSNVEFVGYAFPYWNEMKDMCCEMAAKLPAVRCIGWDLALTDQGWVVVEGNGMTQFIGPQIIYKKGIKKEVLRLMKDMDLTGNRGKQGMRR